MLSPDVIAVFIPITGLIVTAVIVKIISDNRIRQQLIENDKLNENVKYLFIDRFERHIPSSLKWGMILIAVGLAIFIGRLIPYYYYQEEITIGAMFVFGGLALVIFYFIAKSKVKKE